MKVEILAAESLGVRGLCCAVETKGRKILLDPGLALGYRRFGLLPHPIQVAAGEEARRSILARVAQSAELIFSHFHGDHIPFGKANPFQISLDAFSEVLPDQAHFWVNQPPEKGSSGFTRYSDLAESIGKNLACGNNLEVDGLSFSPPVPHGRPGSPAGSVMMTRIKEGHRVFVHASDIQLLSDEPLAWILDSEPEILLVSGPPIYRGLSIADALDAWKRAKILSGRIKVSIFDHHLLRSEKGIEWLDSLNARPGGDVICSADYMGIPRLLLEARRTELYERYPVPSHWHERYAGGLEDSSAYRHLDFS